MCGSKSGTQIPIVCGINLNAVAISCCLGPWEGGRSAQAGRLAWLCCNSHPPQEWTGRPKALNEPLSPALPNTEMSSLLVSWEHRVYRICKGNHWCKIFQYHWPPPFSVSSVMLQPVFCFQTCRPGQVAKGPSGAPWSMDHGMERWTLPN